MSVESVAKQGEVDMAYSRPAVSFSRRRVIQMVLSVLKVKCTCRHQQRTSGDLFFSLNNQINAARSPVRYFPVFALLNASLRHISRRIACACSVDGFPRVEKKCRRGGVMLRETDHPSRSHALLSQEKREGRSSPCFIRYRRYHFLRLM